MLIGSSELCSLLQISLASLKDKCESSVTEEPGKFTRLLNHAMLKPAITPMLLGSCPFSVTKADVFPNLNGLLFVNKKQIRVDTKNHLFPVTHPPLVRGQK